METECLVNGQIGLTLAELGETEEALKHLEKCKEMSRHIKNFRLNLDALICLSRIKCKSSGKEATKAQDPAEAGQMFKEALDYAQKLGDKKYASNCLASLGILRGADMFDQFVQKEFTGATPGTEVRSSQMIVRTSKVFKNSDHNASNQLNSK